MLAELTHIHTPHECTVTVLRILDACVLNIVFSFPSATQLHMHTHTHTEVGIFKDCVFMRVQDLLPMCYRCSTTNTLLRPTGNACISCRQPLEFSFVSFGKQSESVTTLTLGMLTLGTHVLRGLWYLVCVSVCVCVCVCYLTSYYSSDYSCHSIIYLAVHEGRTF